MVAFVNFLKEKISADNGVRTQQLKYVLNRIMEFPGWDQEIPLDKIEEYKEIFELIYITLSAPIADENEILWALSIPFNPELFFGTSALYTFLQTKKGAIKKDVRSELEQKKKENDAAFDHLWPGAAEILRVLFRCAQPHDTSCKG